MYITETEERSIGGQSVIQVEGYPSCVKDAVQFVNEKAREFEDFYTLPLSRAEIRSLVGKKGARYLTGFEHISGTILNIKGSIHRGQQAIEIMGDKTSVEKAFALKKECNQPRKFSMPEEDIRALVGTNGSIHKAIEESSGAFVHFDWDNQIAEIRGSKTNIEKAHVIMKRKLS